MCINKGNTNIREPFIPQLMASISIKKSRNFEKTFFTVFRKTSKSIVQKNSKISKKT
ncbi:hypothetical protein T4A_6354 [Trichinella pseudospiralis]|uniref:Uncharacterized protein n=1 Tax=Trichinella pseudospiralis TaxID=6337 RepID=A0A0V1B177_TRIPS|nr:hypothetical protein T4A_6354 [Trichinella pseudospiralis]